MALLEKIRVKMGTFITVLIGLALLSFIIDPATLETTISMFSSKYDAGSMNGKSISAQEYQKRIDYNTKVNSLIYGNMASDDETQEMISRATWEDFMFTNIIIPEVKNAGINVGDAELYDMAQGAQISSVISSMPMFRGADGSFDKSRVVDFVQQISSDPSGQLEMVWSYLENSMYKEQMLGKYTVLAQKSETMTPVEMMNDIDANNITSDVQFIMQPIGFAADSTIQISNAEIKKYYNDHKTEYRRNASREMDYVVFEVIPSEKDFEQVRKDIDKLYSEFAITSNLKAFLMRNSDAPMDMYYYKKDELSSVSKELGEFAFSSKVGDVLPVYRDGESFKAARVSDIKNYPDSIYVSHILLQGYDTDALGRKADSLISLLDSGKADFAQLAEENSADRSRRTGVAGELGWLTQTYMLPGFEGLFDAPLNKNIKVNTEYGLHIAKVTKRTEPVRKVQVAVLEKEVVASNATFQEYYAKANEIASKTNGKAELFNQAIDEAGANVYSVSVAPGAKTVAGYQNARELSRWLYDADKGDVSPIITVDNRYFFIASLTGIQEQGYADMKDVEPQIRRAIMNRKKAEKMAEQMKEKIAGLNSMEEISKALGLSISTKEDVSFGAERQSFDNALLGAVASAEVGKICGPIAGNVGVYVFMVTDRQSGAFYTESDALNRQKMMIGMSSYMIPSKIIANSDIVDNRYKFF